MCGEGGDGNSTLYNQLLGTSNLMTLLLNLLIILMIAIRGYRQFFRDWEIHRKVHKRFVSSILDSIRLFLTHTQQIFGCPILSSYTTLKKVFLSSSH